MSSYSDDVLVPKGVVRPIPPPGVHLSPAPTPVQPQPAAAGAPPPPAPTVRQAAQPNPVQPQPAPPASSQDDVLVPSGVRAAARPGTDYYRVDRSGIVNPVPIGSVGASGGPGNLSSTLPSGEVLQSALASTTQTPLSAQTPQRTQGSKDGPFPPALDVLKDVLESTTPDDVLDIYGEKWVRGRWSGPKFTDAQLHAAFDDIFAGAHHPDPENKRFVILRRDAIADEVRAGFNIEIELKHTRDPERARRLEAQLSAIALAVWVVTGGRSGGVLPFAPQYGGILP